MERGMDRKGERAEGEESKKVYSGEGRGGRMFLVCEIDACAWE